MGHQVAQLEIKQQANEEFTSWYLERNYWYLQALVKLQSNKDILLVLAKKVYIVSCKSKKVN